ncbi:MAG: transcription antitermination factor NusB [Kiloniellales bacterium]
MSGSPAANRPREAASARRAARLAAAQALYQIELTGAAAATVLEEFLHHRLGADAEAGGLAGADRALFADLVEGTWRQRREIDRMLSQALIESWPLNRLDATLRAILRVGVYELLAHGEVPVPVVINEYIELAHAFFGGKEPGLVNAVLDRIAPAARQPQAQGDEG